MITAMCSEMTEVDGCFNKLSSSDLVVSRAYQLNTASVGSKVNWNGIEVSSRKCCSVTLSLSSHRYRCITKWESLQLGAELRNTTSKGFKPIMCVLRIK